LRFASASCRFLSLFFFRLTARLSLALFRVDQEDKRRAGSAQQHVRGRSVFLAAAGPGAEAAAAAHVTQLQNQFMHIRRERAAGERKTGDRSEAWSFQVICGFFQAIQDLAGLST